MVDAEPTELLELTELTEADWHAREHAHSVRIDEAIAGHRSRAGRGQRDPVEDFLFGWAMVTAVLLLWERRAVRKKDAT